MQRVANRATPLSAEEAIDALARAYRIVFEHDVDATTLAILIAHTALETGQWRSIHCSNWGNVKGANPATGDYCMFPCDEMLKPAVAAAELAAPGPREAVYGVGPRAVRKYTARDGRVCVQFYPPHPQCMFRAFEDAVAGACAYLSFLALDTTPDDGKPNRYAQAWRDADEHDDPVAFVHALRGAGYFTADETQYTAGVVRLYKQFLPACQKYAANAPVTAPDPIDRDRVLGVVALTIDSAAREGDAHVA